jgi:hypothetical protein
MRAGFFLGGIIKDDANDLARRHKLDCQPNDGAPELPASVVERAPEEHIEA